MTARTAWVSGNGQGLSSWPARTVAFGTADLTSLANAKSVLSSASAIANGTNLDMFMDISVEITISSQTPSAGAFIGIWLAMLQEDGTTYGDGQLVAGTSKTYTPPWSPIAQIPIANAAMTLMCGSQNGILIPPQSFALICGNFTGLTFSATAANNVVSFKTYNINLNS